MAPVEYSEAVEARRYVRGATQFYTAEEQAVFDALSAQSIRQKAKFGLVLGRREYWEKELAAVEGALPMNDPLVKAALVDGENVFRERVADRIWLEHQSVLDVPRCPKCDCILRSVGAQQCFWCGLVWRSSEES